MLNVLSLFSGIGAFEKALDNLGVNFNLVGFCEFDKYAVKSYCAIHGVDESMNLGDITKVDETKLPKDIDILTYGFPCQDISNAGQMKGLFNEDGTQTRSGLFFEALRIIEVTKPKIAIAENVKMLTSKKFAGQFKIVLDSLEEAGYNNYWAVLNSKDYGVPQNRERVFIVSIRKDIDQGLFAFPEGFPLEKRLKDVLEDEVDESFYLSQSRIQSLMEHKKRNAEMGRGFGARFVSEEDIASTLTTSPEKSSGQYLKIREATKQGYAVAVEGDSINLEHPNSQTRRGRVGKGVAQTLTTSCNQAVAVAMRGRYDENGKIQQTIEFSDREYANALTTVQKDSMVAEPQVLRQVRTEYGKEVRKAYETGETQEKWGNMKQFEPRTDGIANTLSTVQKDNLLYNGLRIRKLTPKECFRLMGFDDESFHRAEAVNSGTQLYKQAGNSIVVDVLEELFCMMLDESGNLYV